MDPESTNEIDNSTKERAYKKPGSYPYQRVIDNIYEFTGRRWLLPEITSWLKDSDERFFILTGLPGTGKSSIAAWLAGFGSTGINDTTNQDLISLHSQAKAVHFTQFNLSNTVKNLAENLAEQLSQKVKGFGQLLLSMQSKGTFVLNINKMDIGHVEELNFFKNVDFIINSPNSVDIFNDMVREPLRKLYDEQHYKQAIMIVIDGLDEEFGEGQTISSMLASLDDDPKFPKQLRFLITTRPENRVLQYFRNSDTFDLINSPSKSIRTNDIEDYVENKLSRAIIDGKIIKKLASKISSAADDNFLYVYMLIKDFMTRLPEIPSLVEAELPAGLYGLYTEFLNRLFGNKHDEWNDTYSKILGLLTIQQGEGFYGLQLEQIAKISINKIVTIKQFVDGNYNDFSGRPKGPFHIFHKSFADFLIDDSDNKDYYLDSIAMHQKIVDHYIKDGTEAEEVDNIDWSSKGNYPLMYLPYHLNEIVEGIWTWVQTQTVRDDLVIYRQNEEQSYRQALYELARSTSLKEAQKKRFLGDSLVVLSTTEKAISAAARADDAPAMAEFVIKHAKAISGIKRDSPLQILRNTRDFERAMSSADLYDVETCTLWYLLLAWELRDQDNIVASRAILKRLSERELVRLSDSQVPMLELIMQNISEVDKNTISILCETLMADARRIAQYYARSGDFEAAVKTAEKIDEDYVRSKALTKIAEIQAESGDFEAAVKTAEKIDEDYVRSKALTKIVEIQAESRDFEAAVKTAKKIEDDYDRSKALTKIAEIQSQVDKDGGKSTLDAAVKTARRIGDGYHRSKVFAKIAKEQLRVDKDGGKSTIDAAVKTAKKIEDDYDRSKVLSDIAKVHAESGDFEAAVKTAKKIEDDYDRSKALTKIAEIQSQVDKDGAKSTLDAAVKTAKKIVNDYDRSEILTTMAEMQAKVQAESGDFEAAVETVGELKGKKSRSKALTKIAVIQSQVDKDGAKSTLDAAVKTAKRISDYDDDRSKVLTKIARIQAEVGDFDAALKTAEKIDDDDDDVRSKVLTKIAEMRAKVQAESGDFEAAVKTVGELKGKKSRSKALTKIAEIQSQVDKDGAKSTIDAAFRTASYMEDSKSRSKALIQITKVLAESGGFEVAVKTTEKIEDDYDRSKALTKIAEIQSQVDKDGVKSTIDAAVKTAEKIEDYDDKSKVLERMAKLQAESGDFDAAFKTVRELKGKKSRSKALTKIAEMRAKIQAESGDFEAAVKTTEKIEDDYDRSKALTQIAEIQSQVDKDGAKRTLDAAVKTAKRLEYDFLGQWALTAIANVQAESGDFEAALETAKITEGDYARSEVLAAIANVQTKSGDFEAALKTANKIENDRVKSKALTQIAEIQSQVDKDGAKSTLDAAVKTAKKIVNDYDRSEILIQIAEIQSQVGKDGAKSTLDAAVKTAEKIEDYDARSGNLGTIANVQAESGDFEAAIRTTEEIEVDYDRTEALTKIAKVQLRSNKEGAKSTLDAAVEIAEKTEKYHVRLRVLPEIAKLHAESGDFEAAFKIAERTGDYIRSHVLTAIAKVQAESGNLEAAFKTTEEIEVDYDRTEALTKIAKVQLRSNKDGAKSTLDAAVKTAKIIEDDSFRQSALIEIAELQAESGDFDAALETNKFISDRSATLYTITKSMIQLGDKSLLKRALISSTQDVRVAYLVGTSLFQTYKKQSKSISEAILCTL